jgi:hypothetical protein
VSEMNTYYTSKEIEELAAKGIRQLVLDPGAVLTDFARETAQQLGIALVKKDGQSPPSAPSVSPSNTTKFSGKYNKPAGCQHASVFPTVAYSQTAASAGDIDGSSSSTVNRLIDLMGKVIKRGD